MPKSHENEIDIKVLAGQLRIVKYVLPFLAAIMMAVSGWAFGQGNGLSDLEKSFEYHEKTVAKHDVMIEANLKTAQRLSGDARDTKKDIEYIKKGVEELVKMVRRLKK